MEFTRGGARARRGLAAVGLMLAVIALFGLLRGEGVAAGLLLVGLLLVYGARGVGPERIVVRPDELELHDRRGAVRRFHRGDVRRLEVSNTHLKIERFDGSTSSDVVGHHRVDDLRDALASWSARPQESVQGPAPRTAEGGEGAARRVRFERADAARWLWVAVWMLIGAPLLVVAALDIVDGGVAARVATAALGAAALATAAVGRRGGGLVVDAAELGHVRGNRALGSVPGDEVLEVRIGASLVTVVDLAGCERLAVALPVAQHRGLHAALTAAGYPVTTTDRTAASPVPPARQGVADPVRAAELTPEPTANRPSAAPTTLRRAGGLRPADAGVALIAGGLLLGAWFVPGGWGLRVLTALCGVLVLALANADRLLDLRLQVRGDAVESRDRRGRTARIDAIAIERVYVGGPAGNAHLRAVDGAGVERDRLRLLGLDPDPVADALAAAGWSVVRCRQR